MRNLSVLKYYNRFSGCLLGMLVAGVSMALAGVPVSGGATIPPVPAGHPRVYVREADLPDIRTKLELPEFAKSWDNVRRGAEDDFHGDSGDMCRAFLYLVKGDRAGMCLNAWHRTPGNP